MATKKADQYFEGVGRRKTAVARVRITPSKSSSFTINEKTVDEYFPYDALRKTATEPLTKLELPTKFSITVKIEGGGIASQSEAVRHGIGRALVKFDETLRTSVKQGGFLKRDPRMKERKKFGLKKARKSPQWSKR